MQTCKECGTLIKATERECSKCGARPDYTGAIVFGVLLFAGFLLGAWWLSSPSPAPSGDRPAQASHDAISAFVMCQPFIEDRLVSPRSARFPTRPDNSQHLGSGRYRIHGWVDADNRMGATIRHQFTCVIEHVGNGRWRLNDLSLRD